MWLRQIQNLLKRGLQEASRKVLDRALLSLPPRKHIKLISRAALLEYRFQNVERARAMWEGILRNYPKRTDLWNVYLDQVPGLGGVGVIRTWWQWGCLLNC